MQNNFKKFKKVPLILSILLLSFSSLVFFFLYHQTQTNDRASGELEVEWRSEVARRGELKSFDLLLKAIQKERTELDTHYIQNTDIVPFLNMIEKLGPEVGARTEVVLVDMPKDKGGLVVGINATGSFESLYKFFTLLENSPYELDFLSLNMQSQITGGELGENRMARWSADFKVKLLSFIQ